MIILRIPKGNRSFIINVSRKLQRNIKQGILTGELARSELAYYLLMPDDALSVAFLYSTYLKAMNNRIHTETLYAMNIDIEVILPEDVKRVGKMWNFRRLKKKEMELLKNKLVTPHVLEVIMS